MYISKVGFFFFSFLSVHSLQSHWVPPWVEQNPEVFEDSTFSITPFADDDEGPPFSFSPTGYQQHRQSNWSQRRKADRRLSTRRWTACCQGYCWHRSYTWHHLWVLIAKLNFWRRTRGMFLQLEKWWGEKEKACTSSPTNLYLAKSFMSVFSHRQCIE